MFRHRFRHSTAVILSAVLLGTSPVSAEPTLALADTHIHYSHDAWERLPPDRAVALLRKAGLKFAFVSSSSDEGTQKLYAEAPDLVVPVLRPYRARGELSSWMHDDTVPRMLAELLKKNKYAGIGEFHAFGDDIDLPVLQAVIALAKEHQIFLHAHSDADAIDRIFATYPNAIVLWAHSGFDSPQDVAQMLSKHDNLWADLAFRSEHTSRGEVTPEWKSVFEQFPNRFMLGTDTYTPERWFYVEDHAATSREWLQTLSPELRDQIAFKNAEQLLAATRYLP